MDLSRNSRHRKLYSWFWVDHNPQCGLCVYFWKLVIAFIVTWILFPAGVCFVLGLVIGIISLIGANYWDFPHFPEAFEAGHGMWNLFWTGFFCVSAVLATVVVVIIASIAATEFETLKIVSSFISAKTKGICPRINWKD